MVDDRPTALFGYQVRSVNAKYVTLVRYVVHDTSTQCQRRGNSGLVPARCLSEVSIENSAAVTARTSTLL